MTYLKYSRTIKNDSGHAANQHHIKILYKNLPENFIIEFRSVQTLLF